MPGSTFIEILEVQTVGADRVFFCSGVGGLNEVDVSDPADMVPRMRYTSSLSNASFPRCQHFAVAGESVYLASRGDEIQPTSFIAAFDRDGRELATFSKAEHSFEGVYAYDGMLFVAAHDRGMLIIERDGSGFVEHGAFSDMANAWQLVVHDGLAYVADASLGLEIIDVRDPSAPSRVGQLAFDGTPQSLELSENGEALFVAAGDAGLIAVDVSDPSAPSLLSEHDTPGVALQISLDGDWAFVADWNDVRVIDVSDPAAMRAVATERVDVEGKPRVLGVAARDGLSYFGEWTGLFAYRFNSDVQAPDIWTSTRAIDFGSVAGGEERAQAVVVENVGSAPLVAWSWRPPTTPSRPSRPACLSSPARAMSSRCSSKRPMTRRARRAWHCDRTTPTISPGRSGSPPIDRA